MRRKCVVLTLFILTAVLAGCVVTKADKAPPPVSRDFPVMVQFNSGMSGDEGDLLEAIAGNTALSVLNRDLELIKRFDEDRYRIIGNTDNQECSGQACVALSRSRAESIHRWFLDNGAREEIFIEVVGVGDSMPLDHNDTPAQRATNRRVDVVLVFDN